MSTFNRQYTFPLVVILSALVMGCEAKPPPALLQAAEQGDSEAQYKLGRMYADGVNADGTGVTQDYAEAAKWYRQAAEQRHALSQYLLGMMYEKGEGVAEDNAEAMRLYRLAADQGYAPAQFSLYRLEDPIVYATRRGSTYHTSGCRYVKGSKLSGSLSQAKASGLRACSVCKPPK